MKDTDNGTRAQQQVQSEGHHNDGIDRRDFLGCMAWAGTGLLWTLAGGVPTAKLFAAAAHAAPAGASFSFVQISDSHIGFNKAANQDVTGALKIAFEKRCPGCHAMEQNREGPTAGGVWENLRTVPASLIPRRWSRRPLSGTSRRFSGSPIPIHWFPAATWISI